MSGVRSSSCDKRDLYGSFYYDHIFGAQTNVLDYRRKEQCSLKPLLLFYRMFKVVWHFFPFYCVTASMKQKMKLSHRREFKFPVNQC